MGRELLLAVYWPVLLPFIQSACISGAAAADVDVAINVGPDPWNKTYYPKAAHADNSKKPWYIIDAKGQTLGRLASLAANKIRFAFSKSWKDAAWVTLKGHAYE